LFEKPAGKTGHIFGLPGQVIHSLSQDPALRRSRVKLFDSTI
jgi:hypothetical protein